MASRCAIAIIILLVSLYSLLVLTVLAIEEMITDEHLLDEILQHMYWTEMAILILF